MKDLLKHNRDCRFGTSTTQTTDIFHSYAAYKDKISHNMMAKQRVGVEWTLVASQTAGPTLICKREIKFKGPLLGRFISLLL